MIQCLQIEQDPLHEEEGSIEIKQRRILGFPPTKKSRQNVVFWSPDL